MLSFKCFIVFPGALGLCVCIRGALFMEMNAARNYRRPTAPVNTHGIFQARRAHSHIYTGIFLLKPRECDLCAHRRAEELVGLYIYKTQYHCTSGLRFNLLTSAPLCLTCSDLAWIICRHAVQIDAHQER